MKKPRLDEDEKNRLELLVDRSSLGAVVDALAEIADEKAEHIRSTYGRADAAYATSWRKDGQKLAALLARLVN